MVIMEGAQRKFKAGRRLYRRRKTKEFEGFYAMNKSNQKREGERRAREGGGNTVAQLLLSFRFTHM